MRSIYQFKYNAMHYLCRIELLIKNIDRCKNNQEKSPKTENR